MEAQCTLQIREALLSAHATLPVGTLARYNPLAYASLLALHKSLSATARTLRICKINASP
jgi:hypothetical protein